MKKSKNELIEGVDYIINEKGYWVFTEKYHLDRGYCCKPWSDFGCLNCPYRKENKSQSAPAKE